MIRTDALRNVPWLKNLLRSRLFQPVLMLITLSFFVLAIVSGLWGTSVGNRNFGIVFVWIVWWALLMIILVPFFGRTWCTMCPIPAPGEWLQRRGIIHRTTGRLSSRRWRFPRRFKNMWLQNFGFLGIAIFSAIILTHPNISAFVLLGFILVSIILSTLYENRVFCRYVCPVGGFIGLYSMMAPVGVRVKDPSVCATHTPKDCIVGNEQGYGCPWMLYPGNLQRNTYCGMCMECIKTCTQNNIVINVNAIGSDLLVAKERRMDEAYKAFIMLGCAVLYSAVLLGPWGWLKNWASMDTIVHWAVYAISFLTINLLVIPGIFMATAFISKYLAKQEHSIRQLTIHYAYTLVPLGLAAWIAFSLGFALINGSYAVAVLSDPLGAGWNLFGTRDFGWQPVGATMLPFLQTGILTAGLLFAVNTAYKIAQQLNATHKQAFVAILPLTGFLSGITLILLRLYVG